MELMAEMAKASVDLVEAPRFLLKGFLEVASHAIYTVLEVSGGTYEHMACMNQTDQDVPGNCVIW